MPDADDFDVESLRALLRGETPRPADPVQPGRAAAAASRKAASSSRAKEAHGRAVTPKATPKGGPVSRTGKAPPPGRAARRKQA